MSEGGARLARGGALQAGARGEPVRVGERAPDFALRDAAGELVRLSDLLARGPVVVFFYPGDFSPLCTREACGFSAALAAFRDAGASVVGISGDGPRRHAAFARTLGLEVPLLSDSDGAVRAAYGVGRALGIFPRRVTCVVAPDGIVRMVYAGQLRARAHVRRALAALVDPGSVG